jgi:lipid-A-disaccharide synthase
MPGKNVNIMIVAGEASGDLHAAKLVRALREARSEVNIDFFGAAGPRMREEGVDPVIMADELSIVGLLEIGRALPMFLRAFGSLKRAARNRMPNIAVLVDFPDFNLKLARTLKNQGIKVVYYISPQLWAWRSHRVRSIRKYVDLVITILPFEKEWYASKGVDKVEYVGSPLATEVYPNSTKSDFCNRHGLNCKRPVIALLPGSRRKEIVRILPLMLAARKKIGLERPDIQFILAAANDKSAGVIKDIGYDNIEMVVGETYDALNAADAAAVTSGTATLETAIIGTPMAVVYKTSALNYSLLRPLISVEHFGLVNLIAGKRIAEELIQGDLTADRLASELLRLLDPIRNAEARAELAVAIEKLGHGGASKRAAEAILRLLFD